MSALMIFLSTASHLAESIFIKRYNARHSRGGFVFTALISFFSMLFFLVTDRDGFYLPGALWGYAIVAGVLYCSASFLTYVALKIGSYAMTMLILSYSIVMSIGYGLFFLNERATVFTAIGLTLVLVSLYLVRAKKAEEKKDKVSFWWLICVGISAIGSGMFGVVQRMQQIRFDNACTNEFMVIALSFSTVMLLLIGLIKNKGDFVYVMRYGVLWTAGAGLSNGATNAMVIFLHTLMPISLSSPIRVGVKIIMSFMLSVILYREKLQKKQIIGVALGALALVLLNIKI